MRVGAAARASALLATLMSANAAFAGGLHEPEQQSFKDAPYLPLALWTGAYVGVHMGRAWGDSSAVDFGVPVGDGAFACAAAVVPYCGSPLDYGTDGWVSGIQLGYNWQRNSLIFGVEAELGRLDVEDEALRDRIIDQDIASVDYGWYGTLTARLGLPVEKALFFVKGGAAFAEIETVAADLDEAFFTGSGFWYRDPLGNTGDHGIEIGWALGGGVEYALSQSLSVKAEYLYMDFGSETLQDADGDSYKLSNELHTVKLGINYRLNADGPTSVQTGWYSGPDAQEISWHGPYIGVHAAYARTESSAVDFETPPGTPGSDGAFACDPAGYCGEPFNYDANGWMTGVQGGYNWQHGRLVFGIEGDLGRIDLQDAQCKERTLSDGDLATVDYGLYGAVTGRLGLPIRRALVYVKGGIALADITNTAADFDKIPFTEISYIDPLSPTRSHHTSTGWVLGGGVEYVLHGDWRLKAEYLYMDFGSEISSDPDGDLYEFENELHVFKVGVNYYVNRSEPELPPMK